MTPPSGSTTAPASTADARVFLSKAQEFSQSADAALREERYATTALDAVHAGILAADAISAIRGGVIWKGEHSQAPHHLSRVAGGDGRQAAAHLRRLLPLKNLTEYDAALIGGTQAESAALAAQRIVAIASRCVRSVESR
jgi:hypothetical protein